MGPKMYTFFDRILAAVNSGQDYFLKSGQGNYEIGGRYTYASLISLSANLGNTKEALWTSEL